MLRLSSIVCPKSHSLLIWSEFRVWRANTQICAASLAVLTPKASQAGECCSRLGVAGQCCQHQTTQSLWMPQTTINPCLIISRDHTALRTLLACVDSFVACETSVYYVLLLMLQALWQLFTAEHAEAAAWTAQVQSGSCVGQTRAGCVEFAISHGTASVYTLPRRPSDIRGCGIEQAEQRIGSHCASSCTAACLWCSLAPDQSRLGRKATARYF